MPDKKSHFQNKGFKYLKLNKKPDSDFKYYCWKFDGYKPTSIHFDVFESGTILTDTLDEARKIDNLIDKILPLLKKYKEKYPLLINTPEGKIMRCYVGKIGDYLSRLFFINPKNTPIEKYAELMVQWYYKKFNESFEYNNNFLANISKYTWANWQELENYVNNIKYFEFTGMPQKEEVEKMFGTHPLDELIAATKKMQKELTKIINKQT